MHDLLNNADPMSCAFIIDDERMSYGQLGQRVDSLCQYFFRMGIQQGDRVCFPCPLTLESIITLLSLFAIGACACPISVHLPPLAQSIMIEHIKPNYLFNISTKNIQSVYAKKSRRVSPCTLISTSGSSGSPKIAAHSFENFLLSATGSNKALGITSHSRYLLSLPLYHVGGLAALLRTLLAKGSMILSEMSLQRSIEKHQPTHLSMVPTQLYRLLNTKNFSPPRQLQCALIGGAAMTEMLWQKALNLDIPIAASYGMTEMSSQITMLKAIEKNEPLSYGKALDHREIRIGDSKEIFVRGPTLFLGYLHPLTDTISCPLTNGWFATGDIGYIDSKGYIHVQGRKDNMFISGGENIHPEMIERALASIPGICQAIVVPIPDEEYGHRPYAFIESQSKKMDVKAIKEALARHLPRYAIPKGFAPISSEKQPLKFSRSTLKQIALESVKNENEVQSLAPHLRDGGERG